MPTFLEKRLAVLERLEEELAKVRQALGRAYFEAREVNDDCVRAEEGTLHSWAIVSLIGDQCSANNRDMRKVHAEIKCIRKKITSKLTNETNS